MRKGKLSGIGRIAGRKIVYVKWDDGSMSDYTLRDFQKKFGKSAMKMDTGDEVTESVVTEMRRLLSEERARVIAPHKPVEKLNPLDGPVVVRAWWNDREKAWEAIEGSHRLALAAKTKTPIEVIPVKLTDVFPNRNLDGSDVIGWDDGIQAVSVRDALDVFANHGPRPSYELDVTVREP